MTDLSHLDSDGNARMVDIGGKPSSRRVAIASGIVRMKSTTAALIASGKSKKGDVLSVARISGIMATKLTPNLIPMCHPIAVDAVDMDFEIQECSTDFTELHIVATVSATGRTGVEMEALTAVSCSALTVYDMCKSVDREMEIREIHLVEKSGGKSGHFKRNDADSPTTGKDCK